MGSSYKCSQKSYIIGGIIIHILVIGTHRSFQPQQRNYSLCQSTAWRMTSCVASPWWHPEAPSLLAQVVPSGQSVSHFCPRLSVADVAWGHQNLFCGDNFWRSTAYHVDQISWTSFPTNNPEGAQHTAQVSGLLNINSHSIKHPIKSSKNKNTKQITNQITKSPKNQRTG